MSEEVVSRVEELERRVIALETAIRGTPETPPAGAKSLSVREFIISKSPKTSVDTTLLIAYHMEKFARVSPFNHDDLVSGFAQAKEPLPSNLSDTVYKNVRRGFLTEAKEKKDGSKAWVVTNSGERFVDNGLKER